MNTILKVTKFQLFDTKKPIIIYYMVMLTLTLIVLFVNLFLENSGSNGFGSSTFVFLFIAGLNCFKTNFKMTQAFNVSRKTFYLGNLIAFAIIAAFMALIDVIANQLLPLIIPYEGFYKLIYGNNLIINDFIWSFTLFMLAMNIGFFITMLYYKVNKLTKVFISFTPLLMIILISLIENYINNEFFDKLIEIFFKLLGGTTSSYIAVLTFIVLSLIISGVNYLLIKKMIVKN